MPTNNNVITTEDNKETLSPNKQVIDDKKLSGGVDRILEFMGMENIAETLDQNELNRIGNMVLEDYQEDESSLDEWRDTNEEALKLAKQIREAKTFPWTNASNVKFPLIGQAAMNFNARAYPEIVQGDKVVKAVVVGEDETQEKAERAERVSQHMSYQLLEEIPNWETDTDQLLIMLPIVGTMFREVTWNSIDLRPEVNLLMPDELTVNYNAKSLDLTKCRRISKEVTLFKNDIVERERSGLWLELSYVDEDEDDAIERDEQVFIQQLRFLDLDDDGYEEPYMVTVHSASKRVVRIVANYDERTIKFDPDTGEITKIDPYQIYTDYHFIPSFDGGFYSTGFGSYLYPMNMSIDTLINQLIDAGTLSNVQGGFLGKGLRTKAGATPFQPGEWRPVDSKGGDIANNIVPLPAKEPSMVLFNLMTFLVDIGKDMSSITDIMSGVPQGQNTPVGTTLAMIEQGMKVIDAIYKRIYRALKVEFKMLYRINSIYLEEQNYISILDSQNAQAGDYSMEGFDIVPVGDTRISSQMMRTMKAQAVRDVAASTPGANVVEASRQFLQSMEISDSLIDQVLPQGQDPAQMEQMIEFLQGQVQTFQQYIQSGQLQLAMDDSQRKNQESDAKVHKDNASALKLMAEAEAEEIGQQLNIYQAQLLQMQQTFDQQREVVKLEQESNNQRLSGLGQPSSDGFSPQQAN